MCVLKIEEMKSLKIITVLLLFPLLLSAQESKLAQQYFLSGEYEKAAALYEKLYDTHLKWQQDNLPEKPMWPRIMDKKFIIDGKEYLFPA